MALTKEVYKELEDILGPENISEDLAVLEGYSFYQGADVFGFNKKFVNRPEAVVLPAGTEEVQGILKICKRYRIKCKAFSTGYGPWAGAGSEGVILMDLRRMNRILEIDEKNKFVVVEPYVTFSQVQAEAMKRGLTCCTIGAGAQCSFLASHTSMSGSGFPAISMGISGRNVLGVEWVLPTGEVLTLGAPSSGAGWFSGDGPGPSLRGIMRGMFGACGGLGVFTKCAAKLYPWPGPSVVEVNGTSPDYELEAPPGFSYHIFHFPGWKDLADAVYKISDTRIAYMLYKTGGYSWEPAWVSTSNNEFWDKYQAGSFQIPKHSLSIVLAANSPGEQQYQERVLKKILDETGGKLLSLAEEPTFQRRVLLHMIMQCHVTRQVYRPTGAFGEASVAAMDTIDAATRAVQLDEEHRKKYLERGVIMDDGDDNCWMQPYEQGHFAHCEGLTLYDPTDEESIRGAAEISQQGMRICIEEQLPCPLVIGPALEMIGPALFNFHIWMHQIKKTFDPSNVSDSSFYVLVEEE